MQKYIINLICIILVLFSSDQILAQSEKVLKTSVLGLLTNTNTAHIRWTPSEYSVWKLGTQNGYSLIRYTIKQNGAFLDSTQRYASKVIKNFTPFTSTEWSVLMDSDSMAGIAGSAIYGEKFVTYADTATFVEKSESVTSDQENRFGLSLYAADRSLIAATAMGLYFKDTTLVPNTIYLYYAKPLNSNLNPGYCYINTEEVFQPLPPKGLKKELRDSSVLISWDPVPDMPYYGYFIEKSTNGIDFTQINNQPLVGVSEKDNPDNKRIYFNDIVPNEVNYIYRVRAKTIINTYSPYSDTIHAKGVPPPLPFSLAIDSINEVQPKVMKLYWTLHDSLNDKINGFIIERSNGVIDGNYIKLNQTPLPSSQRYYVDNNPYYSNYYRISTVDKYGHKHTSFESLAQPADSIPPAPPTGLMGASISKTSGTIKLHWNPNTEADIRGYRVYYSNLANGEYTQLTSNYITDTTFQYEINIKTISRYTFVRILALDFRENHSVMCAPIAIKIPDIIPPSAANIYHSEPKINSIEIGWSFSASNDLMRTELQRKSKYDGAWVTIANIPANSLITMPFNDTILQYKTNYKYRVKSVDSSDLVSYSNIVDVRGLGIVVPTINNIKATYYNNDIRLTWIYPDLPDLQDFLIYRSLGQAAQNSPIPSTPNIEKLVLAVNSTSSRIAKVGSNTTGTPNQTNANMIQFLTIDNTLSAYKGVVNYRIVARYTDGTISDFSNTFSVNKF